MIEQFPVGLRAERTFVVTADMIDRFAVESGDRSPLHVDAQHARACGFRDRLVHGAMLGSLVSGVVGMEVPGPRAMTQEFALAFHNPCYAGDRITIAVTVQEVHAALATIRCGIEIRNDQRVLIARGHVRSGLRDPA